MARNCMRDLYFRKRRARRPTNNCHRHAFQVEQDVAFVLTLMKDTTIRFKVAAMPSRQPATGIYAVLNEEERRQVSVRTKAALAAAKAEE